MIDLVRIKNFSLTLFLYLTVTLFSNINSDIPADCKLSEIKGKWQIFLSDKSFNPSLKDPETTCGHGFPNKIEEVVGNEDNYPKGYEHKFTLELQSDHKVYKDGKEDGNWTPIYNQGFYISSGDSLLTANFKYYLKEKYSEEFLTDCGKTVLGWYIPDKKNKKENWRCFYATKIDTQSKFLKNPKNLYLELKAKNLHEEHMSRQQYKERLFNTYYDDFEPFIQEVNNANLTWKASLYPEFKGKNLYEVKKALGLNKGVNKIKEEEYEEFLRKRKHNKEPIGKIELKVRKENPPKTKYSKMEKNSFAQISIKREGEAETDSMYVTDDNEIIKYLNTKIEDMDENKLPRNWDWRNVGGRNFVPEGINQGNCGSCYVVSTVLAIESRLRIKTLNKDKTEFSIQFPLSCNFYSEGCEGGYPTLVGKFLSEFEIIPKDCLKYKQSTGQCQGYCDYEKKYKNKYIVSDYGYIGNFFTASNEVNMMKELRARGPIQGSLVSGPGLFSYQNGIYSEKPLKQNSDYLNKTSAADNNIEFIKEEHSILIVGYGEENGIKYWICLNSWGKHYGEDGFFRILRGENEANIEGMAEFVNVDVYDRKTGEKLY
ncbi:MAG: hypothetical protein MJ252_27525 [archaeon]|nr:hypothetical protein [archaeon]